MPQPTVAIPQFTLRIGLELVDAVRCVLGIAEASFVLQRTPREVRNLVRTDAIPTEGSGQRRIGAEALAAWLLDHDEFLAIEFLRGWAEGRFELPRAAHPCEEPPHLLDRLDLLRRARARYRTLEAKTAL